jgi:hypothetical protein
MSWVRFPVRTLTVARKVSTIEETHKIHSCLFEEWIIETKTRTPRNCPGFDSRWRWFLLFGNKGEQKHGTKAVHVRCSKGIIGTEVTDTKITLGSSLCEEVWFRDNGNFPWYPLIRCIFCFRAIKVDKKCKLSLYFPPVTLRTFCKLKVKRCVQKYEDLSVERLGIC